MNHLTRRSFLKRSLATSAALSLPARFWAQVPGANDDLRVAVIGFHGQGKSHIRSLTGIEGVRIVALCDVDRTVLEREAKEFEKEGKPIETYTDVRKLLENKSIDAISTATPNHWHALISVWACQAGKDVYVEKPVSHNVWEGRKIVEAARKYNRIVQGGTQSRSNGPLREAFAWLREGHIGKIKVARGLCYKRRESIGRANGPVKVPESVDFDLWCGPAPKVAPVRKQLHYDWHWFWATGNGDLGNQGIHQMDVCRWALGKEGLSSRVISVGGRLGYEDDGQTPNTQFAVHDFGDALLIFEVRGLPSHSRRPVGSENERQPVMDKYRGQDIGHVIECEGGYIAGIVAFDKDGKEMKKFKGSGDGHHANWIRAVRSRKPSDLNAEILETHLSSALCHTSNISYQLGRQSNPEEIKEALKSDSAAQETLARFEEHLARNNVDLKKTRATLGAFLKMDGKAERFVDNMKANELLTREYRKGFVVPERV
jgi:predicted dehydrogenase